jgi:hypothetical protein
MTWLRSLLLALSLQLAITAGAHASACSSTSTRADYTPGTVSPMLFGTHLLFNQATDSLRSQPAFMKSLLSVPVHSLRFPGGTMGENYLWSKKQTARQDWFPFNHNASANDLDFDEFMSVAKCLGVQPTIVLNLRHWLASGQLQDGIADAEAWVRYANKEKGYGIRYWELGNEVYGKKPQVQAPMTSRQYGQYYAEFRRRLKRVDPSVELGLILPAKFDLVASGDQESWWNGALAGAGGDVDYVVIHRYVVPLPRALERKGSTYDELLGAARAKLQAVLGKEVPIHLTEWNIGSKSASREGPLKHGTIGHALFVADAVADQADYGVRLATFWPLLGPQDQGFLNKPDVSLNVPGRVMQLLSPMAGWKVAAKQKSAKGLQSSLYAASNGQKAAVLINWRGKPARYDWRKSVGNCDVTGRVLSPSQEATSSDALQSSISEGDLLLDGGTIALPAYSLVVAVSKPGQKCAN